MNCRFCKNYDPVGRNGGHCHLLSVPVQGGWDACSCFLTKFSEKSSSEPVLAASFSVVNVAIVVQESKTKTKA
jgi:hypothetical protein